MKFRVSLIFLLVALLLRNSCGHLADPCDDKLLQRLPSPDGKLVLSTYHRECSHTVLTTAAVEQPPGFWGTSGEVVCYVMSWSGRHPVDAVWKTGDSIFISTTDRLERFDFGDSKKSCAGIKFDYSVEFRNEQQQTNDPEVISKMRRVLSEVGACIDRYYKAGYPTNDPVGEVNKLIERGEHRSAAELLFGYTADAKCPLSPATYNLFRELSQTFDLKPGYLEAVTPLVTH